MHKIFKFLTCLMLIPSLCFGAASRSFNGSTDDITVAWGTNPDSTAFSCLAWANASSWQGTTNQVLYQQKDGVGVGRTFLDSLVDTGPTRKVQTFIGAVEVKGTTDLTSETGVWRNWGVTTSGGGANSTVRIYYRSVNEASSSVVNPESATGDLIIGKHKSPSTANEEWVGALAYEQCFQRQLTQIEVIEYYFKPGLAWGANFQLLFDNTTDTSGNSKTVTATGTSSSSDGPPVMFGSGLPL